MLLEDPTRNVLLVGTSSPMQICFTKVGHLLPFTMLSYQISAPPLLFHVADLYVFIISALKLVIIVLIGAKFSVLLLSAVLNKIMYSRVQLVFQFQFQININVPELCSDITLFVVDTS